MTYPRFSYYTRVYYSLDAPPHLLWKVDLEGSARTRPPRLLDAPHNDRRQCAKPALSHTTAGLVRACGWQVGLQLYSSTATRCNCSSYSSSGLVRAFDDATIDPVCLPGEGHILQSLHGGEAQDGGL